MCKMTVESVKRRDNVPFVRTSSARDRHKKGRVKKMQKPF